MVSMLVVIILIGYVNYQLIDRKGHVMYQKYGRILPKEK